MGPVGYNWVTNMFVMLIIMFQYPDFNPDSVSYDNDLAILELSRSADIEGDSALFPICLPPTDETRYWENPNCAVTGYGLDNGWCF